MRNLILCILLIGTISSSSFAVLSDSPAAKRNLKALVMAAGIPEARTDGVILQIINDSKTYKNLSLRRGRKGELISRILSIRQKLSTSSGKDISEFPPSEEVLRVMAPGLMAASASTVKKLCEDTVRVVEVEKRRVAAAAKKEAEEAARLGTAARRIQDGMREHLAYKEERAEYDELERIHQAEIMIASGLFSEDRDDRKLGVLRSTARHILKTTEEFMEDKVKMFLITRTDERREGEAGEDIPYIINFYKEILGKFIPSDRPGMCPSDVVMELTEDVLRKKIEEVDDLIEKSESPIIRRGIKRRIGMSPEEKLSELFGVFN